MITPNSTILFQGDSITDCGRNRENPAPNDAGALGLGYAHLTAAELLARHPGDNLAIYNRGISGNRIVDLYARIKSDLINLKPDIVSILIGVNDTWHEYPGQNGVDVPKYERIYRDLLSETRAALPAVKFVICEPFVLRCGVVTEQWVGEINQRRAVCEKLAREFSAIFVPFQSVFDEAVQSAAPNYWAADGVHPTAAGHSRMMQAWLKAVGAC